MIKKKPVKKRPIQKSQEEVEEPMAPKKDPQQIIEYVLSKLGVPPNLVKVEAYNYQWGEGKDNRWRINVVVEECVDTDMGNSTITWKRPHSFFMHFDDDMQIATYCNPTIEQEYEYK